MVAARTVSPNEGNYDVAKIVDSCHNTSTYQFNGQ